MEQRQLRLGDILDDYCPRERRVTNHAVVAMVGSDVKQTRCTTCDAEHEYKHARVPRQRRKADSPAALYAQVSAGAPKRVTAHEAGSNGPEDAEEVAAVPPEMAARPDSRCRVGGVGGHAKATDAMNPMWMTSRSSSATRDRSTVRSSAHRSRDRRDSRRPRVRFRSSPFGSPVGPGQSFRPRPGPPRRQQFGNRSNGNAPGGPGDNAAGDRVIRWSPAAGRHASRTRTGGRNEK